MNYMSVWIEFDAPETFLPEPVRIAVVRALSIGIEFCQLQGFNFRRLQTVVDNDEERLNITDVCLEMSMHSLQALFGYLAELRGSQFADEEALDWLNSTKSRVVLQRLGQDSSVENGDAVGGYVEDVIRFLRRSHVSKVEIALATNVYSVEPSGSPNFLALLDSPTIEIFRGVNTSLYPIFNLQSLVRIQSKGFPRTFKSSLDIADGVAIGPCQIYSTSKALLRPTNYEEPFARGDLTKCLLSKSTTRRSLLQAVSSIDNLATQLKFLQTQASGLRIEYELIFDFSTNRSFIDDNQYFARVLAHSFENFNPFNQVEKQIFGKPIHELVVALDSRMIFSYSITMMEHLTAPIKYVYQQVIQNNHFVSPDYLEIVSIFERLCRCFMSGSYKFISKAMRLNMVYENIVDYGVPFIGAHLIDLTRLKVFWNFWRDPHSNERLMSYDFYASQSKREAFLTQIKLISHVRQFSIDLRRNDISIETIQENFDRLISSCVIVMIMECRGEFLEKADNILADDLMQQLRSVQRNPRLFFMDETKDIVKSQSEFTFKSAAYSLSGFVEEVFFCAGKFCRILFQASFR